MSGRHWVSKGGMQNEATVSFASCDTSPPSRDQQEKRSPHSLSPAGQSRSRGQDVPGVIYVDLEADPEQEIPPTTTTTQTQPSEPPPVPPPDVPPPDVQAPPKSSAPPTPPTPPDEPKEGPPRMKSAPTSPPKPTATPTGRPPYKPTPDQARQGGSDHSFSIVYRSWLMAHGKSGSGKF